MAVVIPAYRSYGTLERCIAALEQQTYRDFDAIIIDSTPEPIQVPVPPPPIRIVQTGSRLLIHAARNRGVAEFTSELLVFTDPDCYPDPQWLERLVAAYDRTGKAIVGGIACWGNRWLDAGVHILKFDSWLPGGPERPASYGPTANFLVDRKTYESVGRFDEDVMLGDLLFSWKLTNAGKPIWFVPAAVVHHDHQARGLEYLRERWQRGRELAAWRVRRFQWTPFRRAAWVTLTITPARFAIATARMVQNSHKAGNFGTFIITLPVILSGTICHLIAEAVGYATTQPAQH